MSDVTILNLPVSLGLTGAEYIPIVQSGTTKRAQVSLIAALASLPSIGNNTMLANVSGSTAAPTATTQTQMLDTIGSTQGNILYRSGSAWVALAPGTSGQFLKTQGASANPLWADVSASAAGSTTQVQYNNSGSLAGSSSLTFSGSTLTVGSAGSTTGVVGFSGSTSGTVSVQSASAAGTWTLTLPTSGGTSGYVLRTDGSGTTSWVAQSGTPAGSTTQVQFNSSGSFGASANLTFATSTLTVGAAGSATGTLALTGSTSGTISIQGQAAAGTYNFNLPTSAGTSGQPLLSGGGGATAMSFGTLSVAGGGTGQTSLTNHGVLVGAATSGITALSVAAAGTLLAGVASSDPAFTATPTLGIAGSTLGTLALAGNTSGTVTIRPQAAAGTWTLQLPTSAGTSGYVLQTDGSGVTSWAAVTGAPGGSNTQVQFNSSGGFGGSANLTWVSPTLTVGAAGSTTGVVALTGSTSGTISIQGQAAAGTYNLNLPTSAGTSGQPLLSGGGGASAMTFGTLGVAAGGTGLTSGTSGGVLAFTASGTLASSGALTSGGVVLGGGAGAAPTVSANLNFATSTLSIGANATALGAVKLFGSTSGDVTVQPAAVAGTSTLFQLPASNGTNGQFLQTNGSGVTTWATATAGAAGSSGQIQYNSSSSLAGMSGTSWDDTNRSLTLTGATVTTSNPLLNMTQTWNAGAVTFNAILVNVTDTSSASASNLLNLQKAGATQFRVDKTGVLYSVQGGNATIAFNAGFSGYGLGFTANGDILNIANSQKTAVLGRTTTVASDGKYAWVSSSSDATGTVDTSITRKAAGEVQVGSSTTANANGSISYAWAHWSGEARVSSQFDKAASTTLADVTGLSVSLSAGKTYAFRALLPVTADGTGGHKYAMGGTATATSIIYYINSINNGSNAFVITSKQTALAGSSGQAGATDVQTTLEGTITVNTAGTLTVQFAQNAANGTSSVLVGASLFVQEF